MALSPAVRTLGQEQPSAIYVQVDKIVPDPDNTRSRFDNLAGLAGSIRAVGLIDLPRVVPIGNGTYQLVTGERRWRAARLAGIRAIPVVVSENLNDPLARQLNNLISNIQRQNLNPFELAAAVLQLRGHDSGPKTNRALAQILGKSEQWVSQMLTIARLPGNIRSQLIASASQLTTDVVVQIARAEGEHRNALISLALRGATVRDVRSSARLPIGRTGSSPPRRRVMTFPEGRVIVEAVVYRDASTHIRLLGLASEVLRRESENPGRSRNGVRSDRAASP